MVGFNLGKIDCVRHVLAFRVQADVTRWSVKADIPFSQFGTQRGMISRACAFHHLLVKIHRDVGVGSFLIDVGLVREAGAELLDKSLCRRRIHLFDEVGSYIHVLQAWRCEALVLIPLAHVDRGCHRQVHVRRSRLLVVGCLRCPNQKRHHKTGLCGLNVLDRLAELRHAQGDELFSHHGAAILFDNVAHPFGRDLAKVVVGGKRVDVLTVLFHHPRDQGRELLFRHCARDNHVGIANAAFVLVVVECQPLKLVDNRAIGFARGRGKACKNHVNLVALQHPAHEFLIPGVVRLGVIGNQLNWTATDTPGGVDLFSRKGNGIHLNHGCGREITGLVFQDTDLDGVLRKTGGCGQGGNGHPKAQGLYELSSTGHSRPPCYGCFVFRSCAAVPVRRMEDVDAATISAANSSIETRLAMLATRISR